MNARERFEHFEAGLYTDTRHIAGLAETLIKLAVDAGLVVEIKTVPGQPLAMGNYRMAAEVRPEHLVVRRQLQLEAEARRFEELEAKPQLTPEEAREWDRLVGRAPA